MNELEITQCLKTHPLTQPVFQGVLARDELVKKKLEKNSLFIINTDLRSEPGAHWVLCYYPLQAPPLYFDSYGRQPMFGEIENFLLKAHPYYTFNKQQLQDVLSTVCGHYVTYIATQLCAGSNIHEIRQRFSMTDFEFNDKLITVLFRKEFGYPGVRYKMNRIPMACHCFCNHGDDE